VTAEQHFGAVLDHVCTTAPVQDRIDGDGYAGTVTATAGRLLGHYSKRAARGLTIREMARLQSALIFSSFPRVEVFLMI
jgi:hypothetical protein